jgi:hypothetical protein
MAEEKREGSTSDPPDPANNGKAESKAVEGDKIQRPTAKDITAKESQSVESTQSDNTAGSENAPERQHDNGSRTVNNPVSSRSIPRPTAAPTRTRPAESATVVLEQFYPHPSISGIQSDTKLEVAS